MPETTVKSHVVVVIQMPLTEAEELACALGEFPADHPTDALYQKLRDAFAEVKP